MALQASVLQVGSLASIQSIATRPINVQTKSGNASNVQRFQPVCASRGEERQSLVQKAAQQAAVFGCIAVLGLSPASGPALAGVQEDISNAASGSFQATKDAAAEAKSNLQNLAPDVSGLNFPSLTDKVSEQVGSAKSFGSDIGQKLPSTGGSSVPSDIQSEYNAGLAKGGDNTNEQKLNEAFGNILGKSVDALKKGAEDAVSSLPGQ